MSTCSNCGQEITEGETKCPKCGQDVSAQETAKVQVRAVPNIPRRDPDPLPERPASGGAASSGKFSMILLIAAIILVLVYVIFLRKH